MNLDTAAYQQAEAAEGRLRLTGPPSAAQWARRLIHGEPDT